MSQTDNSTDISSFIYVLTFCRLRYDMFAVLVSALYPHYYGWWGMINYINEDFPDQYWHQVQNHLTSII